MKMMLNFFMDNNINICEGYGTTEASPMISVNHMKQPRDINSIGAILDNVKVKIINGEICVSGPNVTSGYYNNKEKNKESFIFENNTRYYRTGDAGSIKDNFLYYEGRISNNYKLSNGKFIEAEYFEKKINHLFKNPFIIYGNNKNYNIIITENNIDNSLINKINELIPKYGHVQKILSLDEKSFSNFLTPKMSLKRNDLINYYQDEIDEIYK
jgi:long-chain acyl-CoA synthetase